MKKVSLIVSMLIILALTSTTAFAGSGISKSTAINKALSDANLTKAKVTMLECELEHGKYEVEFTKKANNAEYDYEISKKSGKILEKSVDYEYTPNSSKDKIGKSAARKKVSKFSGISLATVKKGTCTYEYDDNEGTYEVKFKTKKYRYDYEVLAPTGKIIEYSRELR